MLKQEKLYPRYWPILFILQKVNLLKSHFLLQKYIFLAKVEARLPIDYIFVKEAHGPYCVDIKQDARELASEGLISMEFNADKPAWAFKAQDEEKVDIDRIINDIPEKWKKKFIGILDKYRKFSISDLEKHVYEHHVRSLEKNTQIISNIKSTAQTLEKSVESYPPNYNSYLVQGIIEYCLLALRKTPGDIIQQDYLIRNIYYLLSSVTEIDELVRKDSECLAKIDLRDLEEEFEITQIACKEVAEMPLLEEMNLSDFTK